MAFQRSYSKVWWGSDNQLTAAAGSSLTSGGFYSYHSQQLQNQQQQQQQQPHLNVYHSLDYNNYKYSGNLSRIQEVDDEHNISKISAWEKHDSPGSLRSQDSGFSDNDETHSTRSLGGRSSSRMTTTTTSSSSSSATSSPNAKSDSSLPSSPSGTEHSAATPPTVVRRVGKSEFYSPLVNVSRRISFSGSPASGQTPTRKQKQQNIDDEEQDGAALFAQLDSMRLDDDVELVLDATLATPLNGDTESEAAASDISPCKCATDAKTPARRRRRVSRKPTKPLSPTHRRTSSAASDEGAESDEAENAAITTKVPEYNNETVYLGEAPPPYNNETVILGGTNNSFNSSNSLLYSSDDTMSPLKQQLLRHHQQQRFNASTSTPKANGKSMTSTTAACTLPPLLLHDYADYSHALLRNDDASPLQSWLDDIRMSYEHEVMSTLQTKSIAAEAFKNLTITTSTVTKLIRQLQQRALELQTQFTRCERILSGDEPGATLATALTDSEQLVAQVADFTQLLVRRVVFFNESRIDRRRYEQQLEQMQQITKDTLFSLQRQHYINLESLLDDVQLLRRHVLVTLRQLFAKLVRVLVQSIEQGRCDLMLRANINMIATLTNIDYEGFASLSDAFVENEAVRALLMICVDHKVTAVRALALRALATICCAPAAIAQLGACGGIEIVRDILQVDTADASTTSAATSSSSSSAQQGVGDMERREAVSLLTQITAVWHGPEHRVQGLRVCAEAIVEGITALFVRTSCAQTLLLCAAALNNLSRIEVTSHYSIMSHEAIFKWIEKVQEREEGVTLFLCEQIVAMLHNMSLNKKCHSHLANGSIINFITSIYQTEFYRFYEGSRALCDAQSRTIKAILHTLTRLVHESSLGPELLAIQGMPAFLRSTALGGDVATAATTASNQQLQHLVGVDAVPTSGGHKLQLATARQESYV